MFFSEIDYLSQTLPENLKAIVRRLPLTDVLRLKEAFKVDGVAPRRCIATIEDYFATKKALYLMADDQPYDEELQYSKEVLSDHTLNRHDTDKLPELEDLEELPMASEAGHALDCNQIQAIEDEALAVYWNSALKDVFPGVRTLKLVLRKVECELDRQRLAVLRFQAQCKLIEVINASPKRNLTRLGALAVDFSAQLVKLRIHIANTASSAFFKWRPDDLGRLFASLNSTQWPMLEHFVLAMDDCATLNSYWPAEPNLVKELHLLSEVSECFLRLPQWPLVQNLPRLRENLWLERLGLVVPSYYTDRLSNWLLACEDADFLAKIEHLSLEQYPGTPELPVFWKSQRLNENLDTVEKIRQFRSMTIWDFIARHRPDFFTAMLASLATLPKLHTLVPTLALDFNLNLAAFKVHSWKYLRLANVTALRISIYAEDCVTNADRAGYPLQENEGENNHHGERPTPPPPPFNHRSLLSALGNFPVQFPALRELSLKLEGKCSLCSIPIYRSLRCKLDFIDALEEAVVAGRLDELRELKISHPHQQQLQRKTIGQRAVANAIQELLERCAERRDEAAKNADK